ncbi:ribonuclease HI family protein [Auraticoccus monumenti]|uniref:Ribonuclease H n=1 Tax=Auraticoccus monumenti TaxID=675864 RepID=A0A1G6X4M3_9ACTN|nr:ribonuclease HI family protein [Auraticoccus monumenti]SDD73041.1 ribonuclease HI [Auraticoccus monumenti]
MSDVRPPTLVAAADGSALGNPGPAGWAWYVDDDTWAAGGWPHGTNNMGELMAVLDLLRSSASLDVELDVLCDSTYVIKAVTEWMPGWKRRGWKKADGKPVLNQDLLRELDAALQGRTVRFEWVKGHAGHAMNEAADARARAAATAYQRGTPPENGPGLATWAARTQVVDVVDGSPRVATPAAGGGGPVEPEPEDDALFPATDPTDEEVVVALERELLDPRVRVDAERLEQLLHPHWREVGRSGRLWGRAEMIDRLGREPGERVGLEVIEVSRIDAATMLLLWRSGSESVPALRSSVWTLGPSGWRQRFHQGTAEA